MGFANDPSLIKIHNKNVTRNIIKFNRNLKESKAKRKAEEAAGVAIDILKYLDKKPAKDLLDAQKKVAAMRQSYHIQDEFV